DNWRRSVPTPPELRAEAAERGFSARDAVGRGLSAPSSPTLTRIPTMVTLAAAVGLLLYGRIPQFADYHAFADQRVLAGLPHGADVLSNIVFAIVGVWAALRLARSKGIGLAGSKGARPTGCSDDRAMQRQGDGAYLVFVCALILTAAGSAYYHLAPDNSRL